MGVTHIVFAQKLHRMTTAAKSRALIETAFLFPQAAKVPQGTQVKLVRESLRGGIERYALKVGSKRLESVVEGIEEARQSEREAKTKRDYNDQQELL